MKENRIKKEIANWLKTFDWSFVCTFTTDYKLTLFSGRKLIERMFNWIRKKFAKVRICWVAEQYKIKEGYHLHAIVYLGAEAGSKLTNGFNALKRAWKSVSKGNNKNFDTIKRFKKDEGAESYLTKFLREDVWDFFDSSLSSY